jgi:hypothetical protein
VPVTPDALNLATVHLLPKLTDLFFDGHPFLAKMIENGIDKRPTGGEYAAFTVVVDGPGNFKKLITGSEAYSYGRRSITKQGRVYVPTHIYSFAVEGQALRHASGETGIANLLKLYPEKAVLDSKQKSVGQVLTANGAAFDIDGLATLNGTATYNPDGTALSGILDFADKASQTDTVFNLPKEAAAGGTVGWYNQYADVPSFATSGKRSMRSVYGACEVRSGDEGPPTLGMTDATSFNNYYESLDDQVRYASEKTSGEKGDTPSTKRGIMFHELELFEDVSITDNLAQFSGITTDGIMYMLNPKTWGILTMGADAAMETKGFFEVRGPFKLEGRDAWGWEIVCSWQIYCTMLKANGCLSGTALL